MVDSEIKTEIKTELQKTALQKKITIWVYALALFIIAFSGGYFLGMLKGASSCVLG
jgi:hypothetical protein